METSLEFAHNYWMDERDDYMQGVWGQDYDDYVKECAEVSEEPMTFGEFWRECEDAR